RPGARMRVQMPRPLGFRLNHMMIATEVIANRKTRPNAAALVSQVNSVMTGNKAPSSWLMPAMAKPATTTIANPDCNREPLRGAPLLAVRPRKPGSTVERPRAKKYRAAAVWKAKRTASRLVTDSMLAKVESIGDCWPNEWRNRSGP